MYGYAMIEVTEVKRTEHQALDLELCELWSPTHTHTRTSLSVANWDFLKEPRD